jgi:GxxExxY protein
MGGDMASGVAFTHDQLTQRIILSIIKVHRTLGPGFLESIYRRAPVIELGAQGLATEVEKEVIIYYGRREVGRHRLDLLIEGKVILELKAVEALSKAHYAQMRSYLKATRLEVGLLINFADHRADIRRIERH